MARPREFKLEDAIQRAGDVFWDKGYQAASLEDLMEGTGLAKGSIYKAFHDKRALFLAALDQYSDQAIARFSQDLDQPGSPTAAIQFSFERFIERSSTAKGTRGCLITNTATELGTRDPEIASHLRSYFQRRVDLFAKTLRRAKEAGELEASQDVLELANFLEVTIQGLRVMVRMETPMASIRQTVKTALSILG